MKQIKLIFTLVLLTTTFGSFVVKAQTLHAVVFCNTIDRSIGRSMTVELMNVTKEISKISDLIDYDLDLVQLDGPKCTRANLKRAIDEIDIESGDILLTFYGGHGSHAKNNENDPWPQYLMNSGFENQSNWVPMASVIKWVEAKKPRLGVVLSNCCNVVQAGVTIKPLWAMGGDYTSLAGIKAENYKKLFNASGLIACTSSKIPEPSWCNDAMGGLFTCDFIDVLQMVGSGSVSPDWDAVIKRTYDKCSQRDIVDRDGQHHRQHPYYQPLRPIGGSNGTTPPPTTYHRGPHSTNGLQQALNDLVNDDIDQSSRLNRISSVINQYFGGTSKVMTIGTDMTTVVDYESPQDFLRRICLSDFIQQVIILKNENGVLTVHEVRRQ